jgi:ABC-type antimicrobial peptide transport system, permease component
LPDAQGPMPNALCPITNNMKLKTRPDIKKISNVQIAFMATEALWNNKLRTSLTMLGVIIGISSVIAITSVGQGVQKSTEEQLKALGTNVLLVLSGASRSGGVSQGSGSATTLTWDDARAIGKQAPAVKAISAYLQRQVQVFTADKIHLLRFWERI